MADVTVTAANVVETSGATVKEYISGVAITAGQTLYLDATTTTVKLADADLSDAASVVLGIAVCDCASGQSILVCTNGDIDVGGTLVIGEVYMLSGTAGGIAPHGDFTTGDRATILGIADSTSNLVLKINASQVTRA